MGGSSYDYSALTARLSAADSRGESVYEHSAAITKGTIAAKVHSVLDVSIANSFGNLIRESMDGISNNSRAIAVGFDVTGSMKRVPQVFVRKLAKLMGLIIKRGYIENPHIMFAGLGDAKYDKVPLQVGQFETGNEMDQALTSIYLEGNGGSNSYIQSKDNFHESYELFMYYLARHTYIDCFEKRGQKGYAFILGDEMPYDFVRADEVNRLLGRKVLDKNIRVEAILEELEQRYDVFYVNPGGTSYSKRPEIIARNKSLFGQNYLDLGNPDDAAELIATTIAVNEGYSLDSITNALKDIGSDEAAIGRATKALVPFSQNKGLTVKGSISGALTTSGRDKVARL